MTLRLSMYLDGVDFASMISAFKPSYILHALGRSQHITQP